MSRADELESFKSLNLIELAASYGYQLDRHESSRSSFVMRHADSDKIIIATGEDGHGIFFSVKANASGSVIDFVIYRQGGNLGHARKTLRAYNPSSFPTATTANLQKPKPIPRDRAALIGQWHKMRPYSGGYLESRGLTTGTINAATDRIRLDERGNVLFRHDDRDGLTGWEVKNSGFTGFAAGGRKALFGFRVGVEPKAEPPRIVIAESALDALSHYQLNPSPALFLSFGGGLSPEQETLLRHVLSQYPTAEIITATDNDSQGETFAALIQSYRPDASRAKSPKGKDWNDAVRL